VWAFVMSNPTRTTPAIVWYATFSYWMGGLPICIERAARSAYPVPEGCEGSYEHGLFALLVFTFVRGLVWAVPALAFFVVVFVVVRIFRKIATVSSWKLCLLSGVLGLLSSGLFWLVWLRI
jgi:hypothetical protein